MSGSAPFNALMTASAPQPMAQPPVNQLMAVKTGPQMDAAEMRNYETKLAPHQAQAFQAYVANLARLQRRTPQSVLQDTHDYDLQGAFLAGLRPDARGHLQDTYKKPNHPTFSDQSQYHGVDGNVGGVWDRVNGADRFTAGATNVTNMGGPEGLQRYFQQREQGVQLVLPQQPPFPGY